MTRPTTSRARPDHGARPSGSRRSARREPRRAATRSTSRRSTPGWTRWATTTRGSRSGRGAAGDGPGLDDARARAQARRPTTRCHGRWRSSTRPATPPCSAPTASRPTTATCASASRSRSTTRSTTSSGRSRPAWARATSSPPGTPGASASELVAHDAVPGAQVQAADREADRGGVDRSQIIRPMRNRGHRVLLGGHRSRASCGIQKCNACGELRHPPGPGVPVVPRACDRGYVVAAGAGTVFSFLVHHAPADAGHGAAARRSRWSSSRRACGWSATCDGDPEDLAIGDARASSDWDRVDDELTLPIWEAAR